MSKALIPAYLAQSDGSSDATRRKKKSPIIKRLIMHKIYLQRMASATSRIHWIPNFNLRFLRPAD